MKTTFSTAQLAGLMLLGPCWAGPGQVALPSAERLIFPEDFSARLAASTEGFPARETAQSLRTRQSFWQRDFSSLEAYDRSVQPNRERLRAIIGALDARLPVTALEVLDSPASLGPIAETEAFTARAVRWPVMEGVFAEGLWLGPKGEPVARVVALPDADQTPEMLAGLAPGLAPERQLARRLAENGCEVLVPALIDRQGLYAWDAPGNRLAGQPRRDWICHQARPVGRHVIGYEVQKVLAAVDFLERRQPKAEERQPKIAAAGYAEGGLIAFYAAALDGRIEAVLVSGCFDSRPGLAEAPFDRRVPGLRPEFGDAEIASLIAPRALIIEHSPAPQVAAASGRLSTPDYEAVEAEFERARALLEAGRAKDFDRLRLITAAEGMTTGPGSDRALMALLDALGVPVRKLKQPGEAPTDARAGFDPEARQQRQVKELEDYTQELLRQ